MIEYPLARLRRLYDRFSRTLTMGVRGIVLAPNNGVFLVKHSYVQGWHFPGGGVEVGESVFEALARELQEEGGVTLTGVPVLHGIFFNAGVSNRDQIAVFVVREFSQSPACPTGEIVDYGFFPINALPAETTRSTRARLEELMGREPISHRW